MFNLQTYDLRIKYVPDQYTYMADTLSRAYLEVESERFARSGANACDTFAFCELPRRSD